MNQELWLLVICCAVLALAPLWFMYRANEIGSRMVARIAFWIALIILGVASVVLASHYGLPGILMFFIAALYPILRSITDKKGAAAKKQQRQLGAGGDTSLFRSDWLEVRVDHSSGKFVGNVLQGKMCDWHLHEMDGYDLMHLRVELVAHDLLAVPLLDVWLDHEGPVHWRRDFSNVMLSTPTPIIPVTSKDQAAIILGVPSTATTDVLSAAQARLETLVGKGGEHSAILDMIAASAKLLAN